MQYNDLQIILLFNPILSQLYSMSHGESFQQWFSCVHAACQLPEGDMSSVDNAIPIVVELDVGAGSLEP